MKRSGHSSFLNKKEMESNQQKENATAGEVARCWEENKPPRKWRRKEGE